MHRFLALVLGAALSYSSVSFSDGLYKGDVWVEPSVGSAKSDAESFEVSGLSAHYLFSPTLHGVGTLRFANDKDDEFRMSSLDLLQHVAFSQYFMPYLGVGVGRSSDGLTSSNQVSAIAGTKILLTDRIWLNPEYRKAFSTNSGTDVSMTSIGVATRFGRIRDTQTYDSDGDGVIDKVDECPDTPLGTPVDEVGCPIDNDQDKDGVPDDKDKCPNTPLGVAVDKDGCKIVAKPNDDDQDGVLNKNDYCPDTTLGASVDHLGCEAYEGVVQRAVLKGVNFNTNSSYLKCKAIFEVELLAMTLKNTSFTHIELDGHTDSKGKSQYNRWLSKRRAERTRDVFVKEGIPAEKIQTNGFGETQPIATNKTAKGRAKNRRVVMTIWDVNKITKRRCPSEKLPPGVKPHQNCRPMRNAEYFDPDGDGIERGRDRCPGTPKGTIVDGRGCKLNTAGNQLDRDGDGVPDNYDYCRKTPTGAEVDHLGCALHKDLIERVLLDDIQFEHNSTYLSRSAIRMLDQLVDRLRNRPFGKIVIDGHTDSRSTHTYNNWLSEARAKAVKKYIALEGISVQTIEVNGYGETQPVASNRTKKGRAQNRRVMISIWK